MNKKVNEILSAWKDKYGENNSAYTDERVAEIATNCVSLSEAWLDRVKSIKGVSMELLLFNDDDIVCETLNGITADNLASTMLDILVNKNMEYSKMALNYFSFSNGKKTSGLIGELIIS